MRDWVPIFREVWGKSIGGDLDVDDEGSEQNDRTLAVTAPRLRWLQQARTRVGLAKKAKSLQAQSRTQARTKKKQSELRMND